MQTDKAGSIWRKNTDLKLRGSGKLENKFCTPRMKPCLKYVFSPVHTFLTCGDICSDAVVNMQSFTRYWS